MLGELKSASHRFEAIAWTKALKIGPKCVKFPNFSAGPSRFLGKVRKTTKMPVGSTPTRLGGLTLVYHWLGKVALKKEMKSCGPKGPKCGRFHEKFQAARKCHESG